MNSIFLPLSVKNCSLQNSDPKLFRRVDYSLARNIFEAKGWKMRLAESNPVNVRLYWVPISGGKEQWVGFNHDVLLAMCAEEKASWLELFASEAEKIN